MPGRKNIIWLRGSLDHPPGQEITMFRADVCIHAAWITTPGVYLESPENFRFLASSLQFLKLVRACGIKHIIGLGTCVEYQIGREKLSETHTPLAQTTPYARCKNDLRLALEAEAKAEDFLFSWARIFYPYGPGEHPSRLCSSIIQKLSRDEKIILKTPDSTKDYIYIDDLATALLAVAEKKFPGPINLGTGTGTTVRQIAQTLADLMGKPGLIEEVTPHENDPLGYVVADATRLRSLDWQPGHTMEQGLEKLLIVHWGKM